MGFSYIGSSPERAAAPEKKKVVFELPELKESEKVNEQPLTNDEAWDVMFWSFEYSRGSLRLQKHIIEYLRRHLNISESFGSAVAPDEIIKKVVARVRSGTHAGHVTDKENFAEEMRKEFVKLQPYLAGDVAVIKKHAEAIGNTDNDDDYKQYLLEVGFEDIYKSSDEQLAKSTANVMLAADYHWVCGKGNKRTPVTSYFDNPKRPGGMPYDLLMCALKPAFEDLIQSNQQVEFFKGMDSEGFGRYYSSSSGEIYQAIQEKRTEPKAAA